MLTYPAQNSETNVCQSQTKAVALYLHQASYYYDLSYLLLLVQHVNKYYSNTENSNGINTLTVKTSLMSQCTFLATQSSGWVQTKLLEG